jgi:hypothetical protein
MSRKCPLSKTELQKARRLWEITGENRKARRKRVREARANPVPATTPALAPSTEVEAAPQTKADVIKEKVEKEFADKPRRKNKA